MSSDYFASTTEALSEALYLAVVAPTEQQMQRAVNAAAILCDQLPELEVQRAKRMTEDRLAADKAQRAEEE